MLNECEQALLSILKNAIHGEQSDISQISHFSSTELMDLLNLAHIHRVDSLIYDQLGKNCLEAALGTNAESMIRQFKMSVATQTRRTMRFLQIYQEMKNAGIDAVVMKGLAVREMYPNPDLRPSADEDLLIEPDKLKKTDDFLLKMGFHRLQPVLSDVQYEAGYRDRYGMYLEVHTSLFETTDSVFRRFNSVFPSLFEKTDVINVHGTEVKVLQADDHLLYMILHAVKHFMFSGVGIRQLCDMVVYSEKMAAKVDFAEIRERLEMVDQEQIAAAFFDICTRYLGLKIRTGWIGSLPSDQLLEDILQGGVYGQADSARVHSANITLSGNLLSGIWKSVFPKYEYMEKKYPVLRKWPVTLPALYVYRWINYLNDRPQTLDSLNIGMKRQKIVRNYTEHKPKKSVNTISYMETVTEALQMNKEVSVPVAGHSMVPFLVDGRDRVIVHPLDRSLKKGDIILYRRDNGRYILHRIVGMKGDLLSIAGDHESLTEDNVRSDQVLGYVSKANRKGKWIDQRDPVWKLFSVIWPVLVPYHGRLIQIYSDIIGRRKHED